MDSVLVMIRLTGLLLFSQPNGGPTRVLMPFESGGMPHHVAQIGYYTPTSTGCVKWIPDPVGPRGVCFIRLDNSTLEIGLPGNSHLATLPAGNVSRAHAVNRPVQQKYLNASLQNVPALKGRVTLHQGRITDECKLGRFEFRNGTTLDSVDLVNVVSWSYKLPPNATLTLARRRLRNGGPKDTTWTVSEDPSHEIELFIRHVPDPDLSGPMQHGQQVRHYNAYHRLLNPPAASGPVPRFGRELRDSCEWPVSKLIRTLTFNAGTMSCMVAAGDPP
jgi:hypothetical protein